MSPRAPVLAAAALEAPGDQDEAHHCPHPRGDVPPAQVGDGVRPLYRGGDEHKRIIH